MWLVNLEGSPDTRVEMAGNAEDLLYLLPQEDTTQVHDDRTDELRKRSKLVGQGDVKPAGAAWPY